MGEPRGRRGADTDTVELDGSVDTFLKDVARVSGARPVAEGAALRAGAKLAAGRFEILRRLGEGGMGVVYEAFDAERKGKVALKTLNRVDAAGIYRLKNEFRALSDVSHPNLVRLHELFADDQLWFFTMDLVVGQRLDRWFRSSEEAERRPGELGPEAEVRVRRAFAQLVSGVSAIHQVGKLHRDLKPSNVMVESGGRVVVLDFGLVADPSLGGVGQTIMEDSVSGTPAYMAPEQAAGSESTPASDWYAVGVMLFEALTGRLPFEGNVGRILGAKQLRDPPSVRVFAPDCPEDLSTLCSELLSREPDARPTGQALLEEFGSPVPSAPSPRSLAPDSRIDLVGRERELETLHAAYRASLEGDKPVIVLLAGESGIGKSTLVAKFLDELGTTTAAVVLRGRCYERETVPFKAFDVMVDELSRHLRRLPTEEAAVLTPREAWALTRLFPVLGRIPAFAGAPARDEAEPQEIRRRGFAALGELLGSLRDRGPLVLHIDDLQWTDADSVALLMHLLRQADAPRLLFVGSHRAGAHELLDPLYHTLENDIRVAFSQFSIPPLSDELAARVGGSDAPARVVEEARGNPFLLRELARYARHHGAASIGGRSLGEILLERHRALPEGAQHLLRAIALSAGPIPIDVAARAAGVNPGVLDTLRENQLIRRGARGGEVECYHDKIRESLSDSLAPGDACAVHRSLAEAWRATATPDPERLALHYHGAGEQSLAAGFAVKAAARAAGVFGFDRAAGLYGMALSLGEFDSQTTYQLSVARADALAQAGRGLEAARVCVEALKGTSAEEATDLARRAGGFYLQSGRIEQAVPLVNRGLAPYGLKIPQTEKGGLARLAWERTRLGLRGYTPSTSRRDARAVQRFDAAEAIAYPLASQDPLRFATFATSLVRIALASGDDTAVAKGLVFEAWTATMLGAPKPKLDKIVAMAQQACEKDGDPSARFFLTLNLANAEIARDPCAAVPHLERAREILTAHPHPNVSFLGVFVDIQLLYVQCLQGSFRKVAQEIPALLDDAWARDSHGIVPSVVGIPGAVARVAVEDLIALRNDLERAKRGWQKESFTWQDIMLTQGELVLVLYEGNVKQALDLVAALEAKLARSLARHAAPVRAYVQYLRTWAGLAHVRDLPPGSERARLLDEAAASLKFYGTMEALSGTWASPLEPAVQALRGDEDAAIAALRAVLADEGAADGRAVYNTCARHGLGILLGGDAGAQLVAEADAFLHERGVVDPKRFLATIVPGFGSP